MGNALGRDGWASAQRSGYRRSKGNEKYDEHCGAVWRGVLWVPRSSLEQPEMNLKRMPARTATGLRPREGMREQVSKRFTSFIGLARIEWCQGRHESQEDHRAAARGATRQGLCGRFFGPLRQQHELCPVVHRHHPSHRLDRCRTIGAQESVVPYLLEPGGQDVLEEAAEEFHRVQ